MDANRFFSVPYDNRNDITIRLLRANAGGMVAYGRWVALLGMLYDAHGLLKMEYPGMDEVIRHELEFETNEQMCEYFDTLADLNLIDNEAWIKRDTITNRGVCDELAYRRERSEIGKLGGRPRKPKKETSEKT